MVSDRTPRIAAYTFARHWRPELLSGLVAGATGIASLVAIRSLGAPAWTPQLIAVAGQVPWLFAPGLDVFTRRLDTRRAFLWLGLAANVPLLLLAFLPVTPGPDGHGTGTGPYLWFVAAMVILNALDGLYLPLRGALVRSNYPDAVRGRFFGWLSAVAKSATVAASKCGGVLLDMDPRLLRVFYPLAGVAGLFEHLLISRIRWHRPEAIRPRDGLGFFPHFWRSLGEGAAILRSDRDFRIFEIGFLLYGLGFLMGQPLMAEFMDSTLHLSYGEATWALGFSEPVAYLAAALLIGPMLPRLGVVAITAAAFTTLSLFFLALTLVGTSAAFVALYFLFGATMACVNLGWNLGPLRFAPPGQARAYGAVHLLMVGVRIAIGPAFGYWLSRKTDMQTVFALCAVLVASGAVTMGILGRRVR